MYFSGPLITPEGEMTVVKSTIHKHLFESFEDKYLGNQAKILPIWEDGVLKRDFIWSLRDRYVFLFWRISNFHQVHLVLCSWFPFRDACFHHTSGKSGTSFSSILRQGPIQHPCAPGKLHRQSLQKQPLDWVWLDVDKGSLVRHTLVSAYESFRMLSQEAQILPAASRWE